MNDRAWFNMTFGFKFQDVIDVDHEIAHRQCWTGLQKSRDLSYEAGRTVTGIPPEGHYLADQRQHFPSCATDTVNAARLFKGRYFVHSVAVIEDGVLRSAVRVETQFFGANSADGIDRWDILADTEAEALCLIWLWIEINRERREQSRARLVAKG